MLALGSAGRLSPATQVGASTLSWPAARLSRASLADPLPAPTDSPACFPLPSADFLASERRWRPLASRPQLAAGPPRVASRWRSPESSRAAGAQHLAPPGAIQGQLPLESDLCLAPRGGATELPSLHQCRASASWLAGWQARAPPECRSLSLGVAREMEPPKMDEMSVKRAKSG